MKIAICGSASASKKMIEIEEKLTKMKYDVILPEFTHEYAKMKSAKIKEESSYNKIQHNLIKFYYNEIKKSDVILIVNIDKNNIPNYIGGNSFLEMGFAHILGKKIYLLNDIPNMPYIDEIKAMQPIILNGDLSKIK